MQDVKSHTSFANLGTGFPKQSILVKGSVKGEMKRGSLRRLQVRAQEAYFDEGAAQVKRLLDRDRKELSNEAKPKAEYDNEYDLPSGSRNGSENASSSQSNALSDELSSLKNPMNKPFKSSPKKGAFGSSAKSPFGSDSDTLTGGSRSDMWAGVEEVEEEEIPWYKEISFGQVAIVFSFLLIIGLMLGTAWVTYKLGGVHFNE